MKWCFAKKPRITRTSNILVTSPPSISSGTFSTPEVLMGNHQGPTTLSFFAIDRNLTLRVYVNGSEWKDLELKHGRAGYLRGRGKMGRCLGDDRVSAE